MSGARLRAATAADLELLLAMVRDYHAFEGMEVGDEVCRAGLEWLLGPADAGRLWLIEVAGQPVGYAALTFGCAIEFGGPDGFLDELYVREADRGRGIGRAVLEEICAEARALGLRALHLEVTVDNHRAKALYASHGFASRERYHLMSLRLAD